MEQRDTAKFRATAGTAQAFGAPPQKALAALMQRVSADAPIVIWPYNRGDAFFSDAQQSRLQDLKARRDTLTPGERAELETLIAAAFAATVLRTQSLPPVKS